MATRPFVFDLTGDSDDDKPRPDKRRRLASKSTLVFEVDDSCSDVVICDPPGDEVSTKAKAPTQQPELDEDEDLRITADKGQHPLRDFPHCRYDCVEHKFTAATSTSNAKTCGQCYCWPCDKKASECKFWGEGDKASDHCNASRTAYWEHIKKLVRAGRVDQVQSMYNVGVAARNSAAAASRGSLPSLFSSLAARIAGQSQPAAGDRPATTAAPTPVAAAAAKCQPVAKPVVPDTPPAALRTLPDPTRDNSMMELGVLRFQCKTRGGHTVKSLQAKLNRLGFYQNSSGVMNYGSGASGVVCLDNIMHCKWVTSKNKATFLKLLPLPPAEDSPPEPSRDRVRRVTVVHYDGRQPARVLGVAVQRSTAHDAMVAAIEAKLDTPLTANETLVLAWRHRSNSWDAITGKSELSDGYFECSELWAFRVPKPSTPRAVGVPTYVLISPYDSETGSYEGSPVMLPISESHLVGGAPAISALQSALRSAWKPYMENPSATISCTFSRTSYSYAYYASYGGSADDFGTRSSGQRLTITSGSASFAKLYIKLTPPTRAGMLDSFKQAAVDPSASDEVMAENSKLMAAVKVYDRELAWRKQKPNEILHELACNARRSPPPTQGAPVMHAPACAVVMSLEGSTGNQPKLGTLVLKVYCWKTPGLYRRNVFYAVDEWSAGSRREGLLQGRQCALRHTMEAIMMDSAPARRAIREMREWQYKHSGSDSLKTLLDVMAAGERPAAVQPPGLSVQMRPYQLQSLQFMIDAEQQPGGYRNLFWFQKTNSQGQSYWYSPVFDRPALDVPAMACGGFLAEEMGLGKTVEVLGLILANPPAATVVAGSVRADGKITSRGTLVVCAVSLVGQWMEEARSKLNGSLRICMYHDSKRLRDVQRLATEYDLVVTTYQTLASDFGGRATKSRAAGAASHPLGDIHWHRLVLDESHMVKSPNVSQAKVCIGLSADRRWACTGTPINTSIEDLLGQFAAIDLSPLRIKPFFDTFIKNAYSGYGAQPTVLLHVLSKVMIRHTKKQVINGEEVLKLPPKTEEQIAVTLTAPEQQLYMDVHKKVWAAWSRFRSGGPNYVNRNLLQIMSLLMPLRRICSGGVMTPHDLELPGNVDLAAAVVVPPSGGAVLVPTAEECSVCLDTFEEPVVTPCNHWFCKECIASCITSNQKCPLCRSVVPSATCLRAATPVAAPAAKDEDDPMLGLVVDPNMCESKLHALITELRAMRQADPTSKALVFSQYAPTLQWLQKRLPEEGFMYRTITGSMPLSQRSRAIDAFQHDPPTTIFLLSMRSGAVGINLTAASHVFIMEPCINPALEEQAVGRSWRMGQTRPVTVKKLYAKGTVEEGVMEVVKHRREGTSARSGLDDGLDEGMYGAPSRGRKKQLSAAEMAGNVKMDRQELKVAELDLLFKEPQFGQQQQQAGAGAGSSYGGSGASSSYGAFGYC